ncbi:MAG: OmpA family protein [Bacteroidales bacterium]|nr:OmpA family protein [Bacteroidales bacterium]
MKKLYSSIALCLVFAVAAIAQGLPKTEFQIIGFGGKSAILYSVDKVNFMAQPSDVAKSLNAYEIGKPLDWPLGYGAGLGLTWNFAPHWGLVTGVEGSIYTGEFKAKTLAFRYATFIPGQDYWQINGVVLGDFKESQKIYSLQIPLMFQFNAALNKAQSVHWYLAAGAKLALNLKGEYTSEFDDKNDHTSARYGSPGNTLGYGGFYTYTDAHHKIANQKMDLELINALASIETGFRFKLAESFGLYLGVYADYGLMRAAKLGKSKLVEKNTDNLNNQEHYDPGREYVTYADGAFKSILNARATDYVTAEQLVLPPGTIGTQDDMDFVQNSAALAKGANLASAGVKVRLSFGRHSPKPLPVVAPVKPDTVTVEKIVYLKDTVTVKETVTDTVTVEKTVTVKDTVTVEKVVRDTVVIIKEVPVEIQKVMKDLSNALFKFGSFKLGETEKGYLDTVADWIKSEPEISVEIGGHTDSVGSDSYNQKLSEQRAKAVHDYIVSQGVDKSRLSYKGYGESEPIATNETEAGRQRNRRVELKILQ